MNKFAKIYTNELSKKLAWGESWDTMRTMNKANDYADSQGVARREKAPGSGVGLFGSGVGLLNPLNPLIHGSQVVGAGIGKGVQKVQNLFGKGRLTGDLDQAARTYTDTGKLYMDAQRPATPTQNVSATGELDPLHSPTAGGVKGGKMGPGLNTPQLNGGKPSVLGTGGPRPAGANSNSAPSIIGNGQLNEAQMLSRQAAQNRNGVAA